MNVIHEAETVDAVRVDEICVDILSLCIENQEAILNVSICGKPNEVKIPFSKEVAEVVNGRWIQDTPFSCRCSICGNTRYGLAHEDGQNYCPNCGAKMDGDGNGI